MTLFDAISDFVVARLRLVSLTSCLTTSVLLMALAGFANSILQAVLSMAVLVSDAHDELLQFLAMNNLDATYATCQ